MLYEFNTVDAEIEENEESMSAWIIFIIIIILIIIFFIFFIIWRKIRIKSGSLENEVNDANLLSGINKDLNDKQELKENNRDTGNYINVVI